MVGTVAGDRRVQYTHCERGLVVPLPEMRPKGHESVVGSFYIIKNALVVIDLRLYVRDSLFGPYGSE